MINFFNEQLHGDVQYASVSFTWVIAFDWSDHSRVWVIYSWLNRRMMDSEGILFAGLLF